MRVCVCMCSRAYVNGCVFLLDICNNDKFSSLSFNLSDECSVTF